MECVVETASSRYVAIISQIAAADRAHNMPYLYVTQHGRYIVR